MNRQRFISDALASVLFVACFCGSYAFSYALLGFDKSVAPLWPATGLLLAAFLLSQPDRWWYWYALGVAASTGHALLFVPAPASVYLQTTFIGATQVLAQAWLIMRWLKRPIRFERVQDVWVLVVVVAAVNLVTTPFAAAAVSAIRSDNLLVYMRARWVESHAHSADPDALPGDVGSGAARAIGLALATVDPMARLARRHSGDRMAGDLAG